ncbi:RES family NAD+ phosphorylase [Flavobacterium terrigena]|uniref:RES domain-containing protein n=1 Tax=Flavobacterium terrigena TaxID=402734 RepID=A0A1H6QRJ1_9FLAO|nr:RES family NAD+ phosphorylase [Flavobacterium terrigena]SEI41592.1 RES domain-containing protein [Flavobacterium terrigena]
MEVFRIIHTKWANSLMASGYAARWNSTGLFVIYAAENCSLACLENLVHRNGFGNDADYSLLTISFPNTVKIVEVDSKKLPKGWNDTTENGHLICRTIGDNWIRNQQSAILFVPSAIIPNERNVLINPNHPDFKKIKFSTQPFSFDIRLSK